jgi:hypothetical protein
MRGPKLVDVIASPRPARPAQSAHAAAGESSPAATGRKGLLRASISTS